MTDNDKDMSESHHVALDARDWLVRLTSGSLTQAELEQFKRWRDCRPEHRAAFDRERVFWSALEGIDTAGHGPLKPAGPSMTRRALIGGGAAAMAVSVGLVAAPRLALWWEADYIVPTGGQTEVPLPDGSIVALNTGSAIRIDYRPGLRLVHLLRGEAEFIVSPVASGGPFRVAAAGGNTDVADGRLSLVMEDALTTVTVVDGDAMVFSPAPADTMVTPGLGLVDVRTTQQTSYHQGMHPQRPVTADLEMVLAWRQGKIIFEGKPFALAVSELERYLSEPVLLRPGVDRRMQVSGIFSTSEPVEALRSLARTQSLSLRRIPGVAIILA